MGAGQWMTQHTLVAGAAAGAVLVMCTFMLCVARRRRRRMIISEWRQRRQVCHQRADQTGRVCHQRAELAHEIGTEIENQMLESIGERPFTGRSVLDFESRPPQHAGDAGDIELEVDGDINVCVVSKQRVVVHKQWPQKQQQQQQQARTSSSSWTLSRMLSTAQQ